MLGISELERIKYTHYPKIVIFRCVYYYLRFPLSYRDIEELMEERGLSIDHSTIQDWVIKYAPMFSEKVHKKKKKVNRSWRMDETYIKVKGKWKYLYRAVDSEGNTVDFLLTSKRDTKAAKRFLNKAIKNNGHPEKVTIDGSASNKKALKKVNKKRSKKRKITIRNNKYLNNIVEQDHRGIKRNYDLTLGFKSFKSAQVTLAGMETVRMIKKGQLDHMKGASKIPFHTFCAIAA